MVVAEFISASASPDKGMGTEDSLLVGDKVRPLICHCEELGEEAISQLSHRDCFTSFAMTERKVGDKPRHYENVSLRY